MNPREAIEQSLFIQPGHKPTLLELVERRDFLWLACPPHPEEERLQGDLLQGLPWAVINPEGKVVQATLPVMVINNTCDLQPRRSKFVTVAPASDYKRLSSQVANERERESARGYLQGIEANNIDELLFIPNCPGFDTGAVVHLDRLCSMSSQVYDQALANGQRIASFSQSGFYFLLMKMTRFLARAETSEIIPRTN